MMNSVLLCNTKSSDSNNLFHEAYKHDISELDSLMPPKHKPSKNTLLSIETIQNEWIEFHNQYSMMIKILFQIVNSFQSENNGLTENLKSFSNANYVDLYIQITNLNELSSLQGKKFIDHEQFQNLKRLIQLSSTNTFNNVLRKISNVIKEIDTIKFSSEFMIEIKNLQEIIEQNSVAEQNDDLYDNQNDNDENIEINNSPRKLIKRSQSVSRKSTKPLLDNSNSNLDLSQSKTNRRKTQGIIIKNSNLNRIKFIEWTINQFTSTFDYTSTFIYSKYFCYTNISKLKHHLFVNQRITIHNDLINPFKYFTKQDMHELLPIGIVYKIYLECGQMINLFDWLQVSAFNFNI